ncbi:large conductance mechanosensitive channel protein MscL [Sporosarcina sp. P21c]|uniref:large conductance mechanosensitive channel protein MscL n=1 Tax=unclassified Sporosarcina TaxID=2647733 RepID=UPI000C16E2A4|nr:MULTISPECIES: large conductance mechanosensitive channel protein MscL [unclassified Sporosarcina]PIC68307.1 large conductance mechanosensitive channel protein MscL [Sporosarcina sp. P16a]PIC84132.1 large conductance mechanosensitive channel protein MscL [Sporosarcina sp. P1]PIC90518.1 large conductance mechanosensitive channel protein MscL [Sporosarcina sp. P21c]PIC94049.1 large conductance mechanosensitive channel protein MscL [Sporosarcina sp. P25]
MWKEFKEFAFKGNIFDLAIGVVIGAAFSTIVSSLVEHIISPIIGILSGGLNFSNLSFEYRDAEIMYGKFIEAVINFLIVAGSLFLFLRLLIKLKIKREDPVEEKPQEKSLDAKEELLTEIRDLLKSERQNNC